MTESEASGAGPLQRVLDALRHGAADRTELARRAGVNADALDAALVHLQRLGIIGVDPLSGGCAPQGCGDCPSGASDASPGCGTAASSRPASAAASRGPVAIVLRRP